MIEKTKTHLAFCILTMSQNNSIIVKTTKKMQITEKIVSMHIRSI